MDGIKPFIGGDGPGCFVGELVTPGEGVHVTVVLIRDAHRCNHATSEHLGVVFYGTEPRMCTCLTSADIVRFKIWSASNFGGVQPCEVTSPVPQINCPPSLAALPADMAAIRAELTKHGPDWLAQARSAKPAA
ncbi:MAG TPA: hypothetical protein VHW23_24660 [Kofleriaceae bacterium]|jgi:hypothetical protein|nr:hypothetical protein [Kofleriaceae bacterium]